MASLRIAQILAAVAGDAAGAATLPQRLVDACARALPITGAGVALMTDSGPAGTAAVTDGIASLMEDLQFTLGEGPCVDSPVGRLVRGLRGSRRTPHAQAQLGSRLSLRGPSIPFLW